MKGKHSPTVTGCYPKRLPRRFSQHVRAILGAHGCMTLGKLLPPPSFTAMVLRGLGEPDQGLALTDIPGKHLAADVMKMTSAATVNGQSVDIKVVDGKVHVGGATVVTADILCDNGVIHVIDTVLMPK